MGFRFPIIFLLLALSVADGISAAGHSAAPPPSGDCSSLVLNMADCLSYVVAGGTAAKPEGTCCSGLKTVLKTDPQCLCETFRNSAQLGITLNMTKAMSLPAACHVDAPAATSCAVSPGIAAAPALSPMALSPSSVAGAPTVAGAGATFGGAPAPTPGSSTSSAPAVSVELLVFTSLAAVAAYALF